MDAPKRRTTKYEPVVLPNVPNNAPSILAYVYAALKDKGYDPVMQIVEYLISGEPTYITSHQMARSLICRLERDEIMEELVRHYLEDLDRK